MSEKPSVMLWPRRTRAAQTCAIALLLALTALALYLRLRSLNSVPPWLWWDEATQGLDARDLLHGHFQIFFPRALGKEPLYIYLTVPFVAAWDGQPFAVRLAGVLLGALQVPALYFAARALWRERPAAGMWAGLAAGAAWATSYWAQSINRIGFQVNAMPLLLTLAATAWLNWHHRPCRSRALTFGLLAGLTLLTYLADRVTPLLWLALFFLLPAALRCKLRRSLPWALLAFAIVVAPLLIYFLRQPQDAAARLNSFTTLSDVGGRQAQIRLLLDQAQRVFGGFAGLTGDPIPRHNIPNRPPFSPIMGGLFLLGLLATVPGLVRRKPGAWLLLLWWLIIGAPAVLSGNSNPHFPRLLAALPAALLLAAWPVGLAAVWAGRRPRVALPVLGLLLAALVAYEGLTTASAYFVTWARQTDLYTWFQGDVWSLGQRALASPAETMVVPIDEDSAAGLDYAFSRAPVLHVQAPPEGVESWLQAHLGGQGGRIATTPVWAEEPYVYADPRQALPFYLAREGTPAGAEAQQGYRLYRYQLGPVPDFAAPGQSAQPAQPFGQGLTLASARWGAAYPNPDRSGDTAAGGTAFWAILGWQADQALPGKRAAVDVVDAAGHRLASGDCPLLDAAQERAAQEPGAPPGPPDRPALWQPHTVLQTYHLIAVPATQPAGPVWLEVRVYDAQGLEPLLPAAGTARHSVVLAQARTGFAASAGAASLPAGARPVRQALSAGWQILGADPWPDTVAPGESLSVRFYWQRSAPAAVSLPVTLTLGSSNVTAQALLAAETPAGLPQATYVDLRLPADLPAGAYQLGLAAATGGEQVALGRITVAGRPRVFSVPAIDRPAQATFAGAIKLLGLQGPAILHAKAGQAITVTVVWQALQTAPGDRVRFVHVLGPDGKPLAQADGRPCAGGCPTTSWINGEVLVEQVQLALPSSLAPGTYALGAGWYDPAAAGMPRLAAVDGAGARLPGDLAGLPVQLVVQQ